MQHKMYGTKSKRPSSALDFKFTETVDIDFAALGQGLRNGSENCINNSSSVFLRQTDLFSDLISQTFFI